MRLTCLLMVGVTRFELVTSSVSGKRSPPELNARAQCRSFEQLCQYTAVINFGNPFPIKVGGDARIRTGGESFAGFCLTTWPRRHHLL